MAEWIFLVFGAVVLFSIVNLLNKHIISDELTDPLAASVIHTVPYFIFFTIFTGFFGSFSINPELAGILMFVGFIDMLASMLYFKSIKIGEVSKSVAIIHISPIFVMLFGFVFLKEVLQTNVYLSLILIVAGAIILEYHSTGKKLQKTATRSIRNIIRSDMVIILPFMIAIIHSIHVILIKDISFQIRAWDMFFWIGLGRLISAGGVFYYHHPHIMKKFKKGVEHQFINGILAAFAVLMVITAYSMQSASIVSAFNAAQTLGILLIALALNKFRPRLVKEALDRKSLVQKGIGISLILAGILMVNLFSTAI